MRENCKQWMVIISFASLSRFSEKSEAGILKNRGVFMF